MPICKRPPSPTRTPRRLIDEDHHVCDPAPSRFPSRTGGDDDRTAQRTVPRGRAALLRTRVRPRRRAAVELPALERRPRRRPAPVSRDDAQERGRRTRAGGGKSVIALPGTILDAERAAPPSSTWRRRRVVHGRYRTAEDVGSTTEDMLVVRERTSTWSACPRPSADRASRPAPSLGVYESLRATLERVDRLPRRRRPPHHDLGLGQVGAASPSACPPKARVSPSPM